MEIIERNLQEIGKSLFVSLPKEWTKSFKLKKGSKIKMISSKNGHLSIAPEFTQKESPPNAEIEFDENFQRRFFREYFAGNTSITLLLKNKISSKERKSLYDFLKRFISVQIIEESESKIVLKSFKIDELTIEECMKRLYFLSLNMIEEIYSGNNKTIMGEMRDNMTRFYYLMIMQVRRFLEEGKFTKENQISLIRAMDFRMVAEKIQRIGEISFKITDIKKKESTLFLEDIYKHYLKVMSIFLNQNFSKAPSLWKENTRLQKKYEIILKKVENIKESIQMEFIARILNYTKEISGMIR